MTDTVYLIPKASAQSPVIDPVSTPLVQNLRKSLSVDSLVHFGRDPSSSTVTPGHELSVYPSTDSLARPTFAGDSLRDRGSSFSSSKAYDRHGHDSSLKRPEMLNKPVDRHRYSSLRMQDPSKPVIRGGELLLPSRTPFLCTTTPGMTGAISFSSAYEDIPRQQSLSSLHSFSGRSSLAAENSVRIRSGSLGMISGPAGRMQINTSIISPSSVVTLLVIGTTGCGKSVVVRKGLRGHGLSESISISLMSGRGGSKTCSRRVGVIRNDTSTDTPLHVIEIDVPIKEIDIQNLEWPHSLSAINGVIICYDSSDCSSFEPVEGLLQTYHAMKLPLIVLACKSDLPRQVEPERVLDILQPYDVGLVEVAKNHDQGKDKMRRTFTWILKAVARERRTNQTESIYRNPASPDVLMSSSPWERSRMKRTISSSTNSVNNSQMHSSSTPQSESSVFPMTTNETEDFLEIQLSNTPLPCKKTISDDVRNDGNTYSKIRGQRNVDVHDIKEVRGKDKEQRLGQWATLDELLDKLLFLAVSGDDQSFLIHFLLTFRRFTTPRSVLLAMQKRMRQLDNPIGDSMFACFAQMKICHLLELWIREYPHDFAVRGTAGALSALIKSIVSKTHLLHYGTEFLPFLEVLPKLVDHDVAWAFQVNNATDESDDSYSLLEEESSVCPTISQSSMAAMRVQISVPVRERKPSLPLPMILANSGNSETETSEKQQIKDLVKLAHEVLALDPEEVAQEITRVEARLFLDIKPRHWLHYTFVPGKKDINDSITAFNAVSNHLADWVVSLILCHKTSRARVKQIEKFVEIAQRLRTLNNYSALRAFVAGINNATFPGDETMEQFKAKSPEQAKNLRSWDVLLQHIRSHRAYRLALRNSKGACIPALEVHMSDLIRAHEGNGDFHSYETTKIHWGKFNMMGRFISNTVQCQAQCRIASDYHFPERTAICELLIRRPLMSDQMREARVTSMEGDGDESRPVTQTSISQSKDVAILRKLFFWSEHRIPDSTKT